MKLLLLAITLAFFGCTKNQTDRNEQFQKKLSCAQYLPYYDKIIEKHDRQQDENFSRTGRNEIFYFDSICYSTKYNTCVVKLTRHLHLSKPTRKYNSSTCTIDDIFTKINLSNMDIFFNEEILPFGKEIRDFEKTCKMEWAKMECLDIADAESSKNGP